MSKKGMSSALHLIMTIVVLIVVALAVIMVATGNLDIFGLHSKEQNDDNACKIWKSTACKGEKTDTNLRHPSIAGCSITCP